MALIFPIVWTIVYIVPKKQIAKREVITLFVLGLNVCNDLRQIRVWCNIPKSVEKNSDFICSVSVGIKHLLCASKILPGRYGG